MLMLACLAIAAFFGMRPIGGALWVAWRASSLVEVPATIQEVRLVPTRAGSIRSKGVKKSYDAVVVRYTYEWHGTRYESSLLHAQGWESTDHLWHAQWFRTLEAARSSGSPMPAWVPPDDPGKAVLDKKPNWDGGMGLALMFLLVFGALAAVWARLAWRLLLRKDGKRTG